jgi:hypothetical protein
MNQHTATELRTIASVLEFLEDIDNDGDHNVSLTGLLDVFKGERKTGEIKICDYVWNYIPAQETKENE